MRNIIRNPGYPSTRECADSHQRRHLKQQAFQRDASSIDIEHGNQNFAAFYSENKEEWFPFKTDASLYFCIVDTSDTDIIDLKAEPHRIIAIFPLRPV